MEKTTKNIMNKNAKNKKKSIAEIMLLAMQSNKTKEFVSFATIFAVFFYTIILNNCDVRII